MRQVKTTQVSSAARTGMVMALLWTGWALHSSAQTPIPSRWFSPDQPMRPPIEAPSFEGPLLMDPVPADTTPPDASTTNRICLVIESALYDAAAANLSRFSSDLQSAGYSVLTYRFSSGNATDLRNHLISRYNEPSSLQGAILIGNLPYIVYELIQNWGGADEYESFACDLFYMDMNGTWRDTNSVSPFTSGKYDTWTGDKAIEIWVSRMRLDKLPFLGAPSAVLNAYLAKNHAFRTRTWHGTAKALSYNDDDWDYLGPSDQTAIGSVYAGATTLVNLSNITTVADYRDNHLPQSYELISTRSHGWSGGHGYYQHNPKQYIHFIGTNYVFIHPDSLFYGFFVCSGSDFSSADNLAGLSVFSTNRSGLLAWGSTKTGGMWNDSSFYAALTNRHCFGSAFRIWFNANRGAGWAPQWWYGMVLIGDASLRPSIYMNLLHDFSLRAIPLTNQVALRWTDPTLCGIATNIVQVRHSTNAFPATLTNGTLVYQGTNTTFVHSNLTPGIAHYYTIWVSQDGVTFFAPP